MSAAPLHLAGERLMLDPAGVLYWPAREMLVVSDLHLEKGSSFARRGMLLPPFDTRATLDRLTLLLRHWRPRVLLALGDSFHDDGGAGRLSSHEAERIGAIASALRVIWVRGNHDPAPPAGLGGESVAAFEVGGLVFRQEAVARAAPGEISGHFHPKAAMPARATMVSRPCFVADAHRLLMPAFGAYTGGLDVRDPAIGRLFPRGGRVFLLGRERLFSFALGAGRR